jgi:hypothetical protein
MRFNKRGIIMDLSELDQTLKTSRGRNDVLKLIAIITMIIDHVGWIVFPDIIILRLIGRLSFPIFAYGIAQGYIHTTNLKRYFIRLLIFAFISQPIYGFLLPGNLNIFFTLITGLTCIYLIDTNRYLLASLTIFISIIIPIDYGIYGVLTIVLFYIFNKRNVSLILSLILLNCTYAFLNHTYLQSVSMLALIIILRDLKYSIKVNKYVSYIIYPLHLLVLASFIIIGM